MVHLLPLIQFTLGFSSRYQLRAVLRGGLSFGLKFCYTFHSHVQRFIFCK